MSERQQLLEGYQTRDYPKVARSGLSYAQTRAHCETEIARLVEDYNRLDSHDQSARLKRDMIDELLRRYHDYCIKEHLGAHYRERGLKPGVDVEFEHVIPAKVARDCVLTGRMSIWDALNVPTCDLSRAKHKELAQRKLTRSTPDVFWFWCRYRDLGIEIETRDGELVDLDTWNLDTHHDRFPG